MDGMKKKKVRSLPGGCSILAGPFSNLRACDRRPLGLGREAGNINGSRVISAMIIDSIRVSNNTSLALGSESSLR